MEKVGLSQDPAPAGGRAGDIAGIGSGAAATTYPRLVREHARARGDRPSIREKDLGIWQTWTWAEVEREIEALSAGLSTLGLARGGHLAIVGDNRPRLYWAMAAAQTLGAVPVPLYQDAVASEMRFVLEDAEVAIAIAEDQEQVDKLLELQPDLPHLKHILYDDARGLRHYTAAGLVAYDDVRAAGLALVARDPTFFARHADATDPDDVSVMLYTSGTTGRPKGVCQTHRSTIAAARGSVAFDGFTDRDEVLSYLPMAWTGDHQFSYAEAMVAGYCVNCPESGETVMTDLREIGPTYYFAPPRVFENLLTQVMIRMEDAGAVKRALFRRFMAVARRVGPDRMDGRAVGFADRIAYALGDLVVYGPLRNVLGMSRLRVAYTGGAAIGPDLFNFYRAIGVNLKQLYGQTETCAYVSKQRTGDVKLETVGKPLAGVEVRVADDGEVQVRTVSMLKEYYKRPDATAESVTPDGWFMTGDAGFVDDHGDLKIIDRAKDVGRLEGGAHHGSMFAPQYLENKLKFFPYIKEAVTFGDGRDRCCAFINIDVSAVGNWAERRNLAYAGYTDLAGKPEVYDLIAGCIEEANRDLSKDAALAGSQLRRFLILHKELDPDDDELTRTRKVRRNFIAEKYGVLIDALYSDRTSQFIATDVKFEDGRRGRVEADLRIAEVKTYGTLADAA